MTDQITDTSENTADPVAPQVTPDSPPISDAPSLANDTAAQAAGLTEDQIREYVRNEFKSLKDKRFAKLETGLEKNSSRLDQYEQYRESGLTPAQAKRELAVDELLADKNTQPVQTEVNSGLTPSEAQSLASSLTGSLSQEAQQAILAEVGAKAFTDADSLSQFVVSQAGTAKPGSSATPATPSAGESGGQLSPEALLNEYTTKVIANRGNPAEINKLKADYREQGLDVDNVVFTV